MQVVFHAGVHKTDEDKLVGSLIKNRAVLARNGTIVPNPGSYRKSIRVLLRNADAASRGKETRGRILNAASPDMTPDRLILSAPSLLGPLKTAAIGGVLYNQAEFRIGVLAQAFPDDEIEIFFAIRDLATFLPAMLEASCLPDMAEYLQGSDPATMGWADLVRRVNSAFPNMRVTVWCNEDTPLIWAQILRGMAGLEPAVALENEFALLQDILSAPGLHRFKKFLAENPELDDTQKRHVVVAFLEKFADEAAIEEELDVPGWTQDLVAQLSARYDEDVHAIQQIPGVNFIAP